MNPFFIKKAVTAVLFLFVLFAGFLLNFSNTYGEIKETVRQEKDMSALIASIDTIVNENAFAKYSCIELYGYIQDVLYKNEENDFEVVKDKNGFLHYMYFENKAKDTSNLVDSLKTFQNELLNQNTNFMYVMPPDKYIEGYTEISTGLPYHYANETADDFLARLQKEGISYLDYRQKLGESGIPYEKLFYQTDHHWTIETAFWAYTSLLDYLENEYDQTFKHKEYYTDLNNYNCITYPNSFIGSMGRKTGTLYSGVDDFTLIYPKFVTDFSYDIETGDVQLSMEGRFDEALLVMEPFIYKGNKYDVQADKYSSYLYGNQGIAHIKNNLNTEGPKVLIVKDSFMVPVAAFLSTVCSDVYLVDPRYYEGNIIDFTNDIEELDYVMVAFSPQDLTEEFFRFGE